ncbi:MAG: nicotinate-nicotinamide nucleotide adenylyltransferase [Erysipelotrichaceae bacterium]|nr:nicotinate-nicotinamide nucleotide adenylyltransferase [Erysipelotrichaceae bacterium]
MKIGIYIGSFDPVHKGHIRLARHLLKKHYVDHLLIVPTGNYWNKQDLTPIEERVGLLKLFENEDLEIETEYNSLPYTYQLLRKLKERYPDDELDLILGADNLLHFEDWKNAWEIMKYPWIILKRDGIDIRQNMERLKKKDYVVVNDIREYDISSSYIRENIGDYEKVKDFIHKKVYLRYRKILDNKS